VVGTGLAGGLRRRLAGRARLQREGFCYQDSPRRAHSIAAQGGINAAKNYQNDGDSVYRLFYDTVKGGDFRSREANVYRLAEVSVNIIDQCVAQGVPFAREYGGLLANRSFGGAQVSRTFYARGQTGQQLLLGAYSGAQRQVAPARWRCSPHGDARPRRGRRQSQGHHHPRPGHRRDRAPRRRRGGARHRRLRQRLLPLDQRHGLQRHRGLARAQARRGFRQPLLHADPPDLHPGQRRLPVQAHADERVAPQRRPGLGAQEEGRRPPARDIPEDERDYYLERKYPSFGNLVPATSPPAAKEVCDEGRGVGPTGWRLPRLPRRHRAPRRGHHPRRYGNLFEMYEKITGENPYKVPMRSTRPCTTPWAACGWTTT
jgi:succinate dehydrogenase / fumarate reductase flavoprotein subunit